MKTKLFKKFLFLFFTFILGTIIYILGSHLLLSGKSTPHKVYIAFGFHANLYHSFRIDTNDEAGFGRDIRVIRHIIKTFDEFNSKGIPAKAVWDIENLFSLQEKLPQYAPDIIENIKRRVKENGDEVILMSYNNGLVSAMTEQELKDVIERAIQNPQKSGVADLFPSWSPIVRPQEMMTTPGNFRIYKELDINTISLYYSSITFDTFRVFSRPLTKEEAHNPLIYENKETNETIQLIPTYNIGDLIENVSLRNWVKDLHKEQLRGNINKDVLIFINFDADDNYWSGLTLPDYLKWLPNTGGISQLLEEVSGLEYVKFTNLQEYLSKHETVGKVSFGQDTADGSFNGYNSWSEKSYSHDYWSEVVKDRRIHNFIKRIYKTILKRPIPNNIQKELDESYEKRLRLTSTTNFGMATPFLARARERIVENTITDMNQHSKNAWSTSTTQVKQLIKGARKPNISKSDLKFLQAFLLVREEDEFGSFITLKSNTKLAPNEKYYLYDKAGQEIPVYDLSYKPDVIKLFIKQDTKLDDTTYFLYSGNDDSKTENKFTQANKNELKNQFVSIKLDERGYIKHIFSSNEEKMLSSSLIPRIQYKEGNFYSPDSLEIKVLKNGESGVAQIRLLGDFNIDGQIIEEGKIDYILTLIEGIPYVYLDAHLKYPETFRNTKIKPHFASLTRMIDNNWIEAIPAEVNFAIPSKKEKPFKIIKRNYLGVESSYLIDYFNHSDENLNLDNVNNHISAEYIALAAENSGIAIAMDTGVLSNFAFCPIKIEYENENFYAKLNPFGTYYGKQYKQPTWGHGQGFESAFLAGQQYWTSASTYNGHEYKFSLMFAFFPGRKLPQKLKNDMLSFSHPPKTIQIIETKDEKKETGITSSPLIPRGFVANYGMEPNTKKYGVYFHWERLKNSPKNIKIHVGKQPGKHDVKYTQDGDKTSLFVEKYQNQNYQIGKKYYAVISSENNLGKQSKLSEEIVFTPQTRPQKEVGPKLPILLQIKIIFYTLLSYIL